MRISVDTNVLRVVVPGDETQQKQAIEAPRAADSIAISVHALCELAWVMERAYDPPRAEIAAAIRLFMKTSNGVLNRPAVEAGPVLLDAGGDFADGVIAYDGRRLGGETFGSLDRKAVMLPAQRGLPAQLLG